MLCSAVSVMFNYSLGGRKKMVMCAAVSVNVCYMVGVSEGSSVV